MTINVLVYFTPLFSL